MQKTACQTHADVPVRGSFSSRQPSGPGEKRSRPAQRGGFLADTNYRYSPGVTTSRRRFARLRTNRDRRCIRAPAPTRKRLATAAAAGRRSRGMVSRGSLYRYARCCPYGFLAPARFSCMDVCVPIGNNVIPAPVGMDPHGMLRGLDGAAFPRACGDGPENVSSGPGFPALAGRGSPLRCGPERGWSGCRPLIVRHVDF